MTLGRTFHRQLHAGEPEDFGRIALGFGRPPARARRVASIGHARSREPLGQVVVRQADRRRSGCDLRLTPANPGPFRRRERGDRHDPDPGCPRRRAAECLDQTDRIAGGASVVPEHRRPQRPARGIQADQAVLLPCDGKRSYLVGQAGLGEGAAECLPPDVGMSFACSAGSGHGVFGAAGRDDLARCPSRPRRPWSTGSSSRRRR